MFCPKCGIGNLGEQKFCRGCGHALAGHRAALENNFGDAIEKLKSGSALLGASAAVLMLISLMALGVWVFQKDAGAFFILIPVLAFAIPATILGLVWLNRAYRTLSAADRAKLKPAGEGNPSAINLAAATTDPLALSSQAPPSITEHTTLNLKSSEPAAGEARGSSQVDSPSSAS